MVLCVSAGISNGRRGRENHPAQALAKCWERLGARCERGEERGPAAKVGSREQIVCTDGEVSSGSTVAKRRKELSRVERL